MWREEVIQSIVKRKEVDNDAKRCKEKTLMASKATLGYGVPPSAGRRIMNEKTQEHCQLGYFSKERKSNPSAMRRMRCQKARRHYKDSGVPKGGNPLEHNREKKTTSSRANERETASMVNRC